MSLSASCSCYSVRSPPQGPREEQLLRASVCGLCNPKMTLLGEAGQNGFQHGKRVNRGGLSDMRIYVTLKHILVSTLTLWGVVHTRPSPESHLNPSGLHDLLSCSYQKNPIFLNTTTELKLFF